MHVDLEMSGRQRGDRVVARVVDHIGHGRLRLPARDEDDDRRVLVDAGPGRGILVEHAARVDVLVRLLSHLRCQPGVRDLLDGEPLELPLDERHRDRARAGQLLVDLRIDVVGRDPGRREQERREQPGPDRAAPDWRLVLVVAASRRRVAGWRDGSAGRHTRDRRGRRRALEHRRGRLLGDGGDREPCSDAREVGVHLPCAPVARLGILRERPQDDGVECGGDLRPLRRRRLRDLRDVLHRHLERRVAGEGDAAREHLVEDDAGGVKVGRRPRRRSARLLGREVLRRADDRSRLRHLARGGAGDAEVHHLQAPVGSDDDVVRLDVAVDGAVPVRELERGEDLARVVDRDADRRAGRGRRAAP